MSWLMLLVAATPAHLYHVDLSRAVLATAEGRALLGQIDAAREDRQSRLQVERQRLMTQRGRLTAGAYAARVEALNARVAAAEAELERLQADGVEPIVAKMHAQLEAWSDETTRTVARSDVELLVPNPLCDRTGRLVEAYRGATEALPEIGACRVKRFARVRVRKAMHGSKLASDQARKLRALQQERQGELDRFRKALSALSARARTTRDARMMREAQAQQRDLDQRFLRYQGEFEAAERAAESKLRARLEAVVEAATEAHPGVVFFDLGEASSGWAPGCDATEWVTASVDGAEPARALPGGCGAR